MDIDVGSFIYGVGLGEPEEKPRRRGRGPRIPTLRLDEIKVEGRRVEAAVVNVGQEPETIDNVTLNVIERRRYTFVEKSLLKDSRVVEREEYDRYSLRASVKPSSFTLMPGEGVKLVAVAPEELVENKIYELRLTRNLVKRNPVTYDTEVFQVGVCYWFKKKGGRIARLTLSLEQAEDLISSEVDPFEPPSI